MFRILCLALAALLPALSGAAAGTLDRIRDTGVLKIGYREDAPPFSYKDPVGEPAGYTVALCRAVAAGIKAQLKLEKFTLTYVPVTAENRFQAVADGKVDLLCGATTATLSRREMVDFSLPTFIDGAGVLLRSDGPQRFSDLNGKKIGVRAGTTTEAALGNTLRELSMTVETAAVTDHKDGLAKLLNDEIAAYFADRGILFFLMAGSSAAEKLFLSPETFTYEPYALALQKGDGDFRLAVDTAISTLYRDGRMKGYFEESFPGATPGLALRALFLLGPDMP